MTGKTKTSRTTTAIAIGFPMAALAWSLYFNGWHIIPATVLLAATVLVLWQVVCYLKELRRVSRLQPSESSPSRWTAFRNRFRKGVRTVRDERPVRETPPVKGVNEDPSSERGGECPDEMDDDAISERIAAMSPSERTANQDLQDLLGTVENARVLAEQQPNDANAIRALADATAEFAFELGFHESLLKGYEAKSNEAIGLYHRALEQDAEDGLILNNLAVSLSDLGKHDSALPLLKKAAVVMPNDRNIRFNLGVVLTALRRDREARMAFEEAFELELGGKTRQAYFDPHAL